MSDFRRSHGHERRRLISPPMPPARFTACATRYAPHEDAVSARIGIASHEIPRAARVAAQIDEEKLSGRAPRISRLRLGRDDAPLYAHAASGRSVSDLHFDEICRHLRPRRRLRGFWLSPPAGQISSARQICDSKKTSMLSFVCQRRPTR